MGPETFVIQSLQHPLVARLNTVIVDFDRWMKENEEVERVVDALDYIEENETKDALVEELKKVNKCNF